MKSRPLCEVGFRLLFWCYFVDYVRKQLYAGTLERLSIQRINLSRTQPSLVNKQNLS